MRRIELFNETSVEVSQDFNGPIGASVYDCCLTLCAAFAQPFWRQRVFSEGSRVLDLSCGTGALGMAVCKCFEQQVAKVVLCDRPPLVPLIQQNVAQNNLQNKCRVEAFTWGDDANVLLRDEPPFDVVLLSDVVALAYHQDYEKLFASVRALTDEKTRIIIAIELRTIEDAAFVVALPSYGFTVERLPDDVLDADWVCEEIRVFMVQKLPR